MMSLMIQPLFIGTTELILIAALALLLFGGKKLPEMMRGMGKGVREFKEGLNEKPEDNTPPQVQQQNGEDDSRRQMLSQSSTSSQKVRDESPSNNN